MEPARSTPRQRVEAECHRRGTAAVVEACVALIESKDAAETGAAFLRTLAGPAAEPVIAAGEESYWPRVWGARGLLYAWDGSDRAIETITAATRDEHWRVREMALKVIARHEIGDALDAVAERRRDPVPRVREAAARAGERIVAARA